MARLAYKYIIIIYTFFSLCLPTHIWNSTAFSIPSWNSTCVFFCLSTLCVSLFGCRWIMFLSLLARCLFSSYFELIMILCSTVADCRDKNAVRNRWETSRRREAWNCKILIQNVMRFFFGCLLFCLFFCFQIAAKKITNASIKETKRATGNDNALTNKQLYMGASNIVTDW